jgi:long-chain acyl-CoA synthetase
MRNFFFVGASEYFATPLMARFARMVNIVPVDPDTNLVRAMQAGAYGLRLGKVLILFPEGERSIDGEIKKFKKGAPILSTHLKAPIVPIALEGVFDVWPRGRRLRLRSLVPGMNRTWMRCGAPLSPPEPLPAGASFSQAEAYYSAAAERLRAAVAAM